MPVAGDAGMVGGIADSLAQSAAARTGEGPLAGKNRRAGFAEELHLLAQHGLAVVVIMAAVIIAQQRQSADLQCGRADRIIAVMLKKPIRAGMTQVVAQFFHFAPRAGLTAALSEG